MLPIALHVARPDRNQRWEAWTNIARTLRLLKLLMVAASVVASAHAGVGAGAGVDAAPDVLVRIVQYASNGIKSSKSRFFDSASFSRGHAATSALRTAILPSSFPITSAVSGANIAMTAKVLPDLTKRQRKSPAFHANSL